MSYDPVAAAWNPLVQANAPSARSSHSAIWTGSEMIIWGGDDGTIGLDTGGRYRP